MADKKTVLVLFGGMSSEHEVSCSSAASILRNIDRDKYNVRVIGITKKGAWIETAAPPEMIEDGTWINRINNRNAFICPDRRVHGIRTEKGKDIRIDCVFSVLHGKYGEDGSMQGLLEMAGIPYAGSGVLSSASTMDKLVTKILANEGGIKQADYCAVDWFTFATQAASEIQRIEDKLGAYPYFVKPANTGSSVSHTGCRKCRCRDFARRHEH
ncbi:MAG: D-alanine--D-alanine ligase, partial [Firmicutes bacterium]|nr:D-alanine--D-alanine ligase [Bacillota bacterium]